MWSRPPSNHGLIKAWFTAIMEAEPQDLLQHMISKKLIRDRTLIIWWGWGRSCVAFPHRCFNSKLTICWFPADPAWSLSPSICNDPPPSNKEQYVIYSSIQRRLTRSNGYQIRVPAVLGGTSEASLFVVACCTHVLVACSTILICRLQHQPNWLLLATLTTHFWPEIVTTSNVVGLRDLQMLKIKAGNQ